MGNTAQQRISSKIGLVAASAALILAVGFGLGAATTQSAQAQTLSVLYNFGGASDGGDPYPSLIRDAAGNLYSTFGYGGGTSFSGGVYKVAPDGTESVLYSFTGGADGAFPISPVIRDNAGNVYGMTTQGGSSGAGVVFKVDSNGTETVLHNFTGGTDGADPTGGLLRDKAGNLYGVTSQGGPASDGVVFKINTHGKETILHTFTGGATDGKYPTYTSLLLGTRGTLYGVTQEGGSADGGTLYRLSKGGKLTVLYSFKGGKTDGCNVLGTPVRDKAGNFYGTTSSCGAHMLGTVWKVNKNGKDRVLHSFAGGTSDGEYSLAGVIVDVNGNLYGTTETGGQSNLGTVYGVSKTGKFTLLHSFAGPDGKYVYGGLVRDAKGTLYGTAINGGKIGYGTVWKLSK